MWIVVGIAAVVGFIAGLLVGRRNPKVADLAASGANAAVAAGKDVAAKVK